MNPRLSRAVPDVPLDAICPFFPEAPKNPLFLALGPLTSYFHTESIYVSVFSGKLLLLSSLSR